MSAREYYEAEKHFRKAIDHGGWFILPWLGLGDCLMRLKNYGRALYVYGQALNYVDSYSAPRRAEFAALSGRGAAYLHLDRHDKALEIAEKLEAMNVDKAEAQGLKARALFGLRPSDAIQVAEAALKLGYRDAYMELRLAGELVMEGRLKDAKRLVEGTDIDPEDHATRHERASVLIRLGEANEAIEELCALEGKAEPFMLLNTLASAYHVAGDRRAAADSLLEALEIRRDEVILVNTSMICLATGKPKLAETFAREALQVKPGWPDAMYILGSCYAASNKPVTAREQFKKVLEAPEAREVLKALATELLARLDRDQEIETEYKRLGLITTAYGEREQERQLLVHFKSLRFEDECCRLVKQKLLRWSSSEPRKKLKHAGKEKEIDAYGFRRSGTREVICLGECKLRLDAMKPVNDSEINELVQNIALARSIESESGREVEGYFFANASYDYEAKELAKTHSIRLFKAHLTKDWQKRADWKVNVLQELQS